MFKLYSTTTVSRITLFSILFLTFFIGQAQCPTGDITLYTQEQVDNFKINYPSCTEFSGNLTIAGQIDIKNLDGLRNLTKIGGTLKIGDNGRYALTTGLPDLDGLENLTRIEGNFEMYTNSMLQNIQHLSNLEYIGNDLIIESNWYLDHILGLEKLTHIYGDLIIKDNREVVSLMGLENITQVDGDLVVMNTIEGNGIQGLNGIENVGGNLDLFYVNAYNSNVNPFPNLTEVVGAIRIVDSDETQSIAGFEALTTAKSLHIRLVKALDVSGFNALTTLGGLSFQTNRKLTDISGFQSLELLPNLSIDDEHNDLISLSGISAIPSIDYILISETGFVNFNEFNALTTSKRITFKNNYFLETLDGFGSLATIENEIEINNSDRLTTIDAFSSLENARILTIKENKILNNIPGFNNLKSLPGSLKIENNEALSNMSGLSSLESVGNFDFMGNSGIKDFKDFTSLTSVTGLFRLKGNGALEDLEGLENLQNLGSFVIIEVNASLLSLKGIENVIHLGEGSTSLDLRINSNASLNDISALDGINHESYGKLQIKNNPNLEICSNANVCGKISLNDPTKVEISSNAPGCNTIEEVAASCNLNRIEGVLSFNVANDNCATGTPIPNFRILTNDGTKNMYTFTDANGAYSYNLSNGIFETSVVTQSSILTMDPNMVNTTFSLNNETEVINFCASPTSIFKDLKITLIPISDARPGFTSEYKLVYENVGTEIIANGEITLEFDDVRLNFIDAAPQVLEVTGNQLKWSFTDLKPFHSSSIKLDFQIEAPPVAEINETLEFVATVPVTNDNTPENNEFTLKQLLIGSYDPNDKQVLEGEYVSIHDIDGYLNYVVRFQNTGTASAINVRIEDELHSKLDWSTFEPVSMSHNGRIEITDENHVTYFFDDIHLPDETSDEPGSHGYISYRIKPKSDVVVGDVISGNASIYFDYNPPIITNTVHTEIVLPDMDGDGIDNDDDNCPIQANPDQEDENGNGIGDICETLPLVASIALTQEINCSNGFATLAIQAEGGIAPYVYELYDANTDLFITSTSSNNIDSVVEGSYYVKVSDNTGNAVISNQIEVLAPEPLQTTLMVTQVSCSGAADAIVSVSVNGGVGGYQFALNGILFQDENEFTDLDNGAYFMVVRDAYGCESIQDFIIESPIPIAAEITTTPASCTQGAIGSIEINATGGTGVLKYSIGNGAFFTTPDFTGLSSGRYDVLIQDENGCSLQMVAEVAMLDDCVEFSLPQNNFSIEIQSESCASSNNGAIVVRAEKDLPYTINIMGNGLNETKTFRSFASFSALEAGVYSLCITVDTQTGYVQCFEAVIIEPQPLEVDATLNVELKEVSIKLKGGDHYKIVVNDTEYELSSSEIVLPLEDVENKLVVKTDLDCQGIFEDTFIIPHEELSVYPNPIANGELNVLLGTETEIEQVLISVFSGSGQLVLETNKELSKGQFQVDVDHLPAGIYTMMIRSETINKRCLLVVK